jgi:hypothetical protein
VRLVRYLQSSGIRHILRNPAHPAAIGDRSRWPAPTAGSQGKTYPTLIGHGWQAKPLGPTAMPWRCKGLGVWRGACAMGGRRPWDAVTLLPSATKAAPRREQPRMRWPVKGLLKSSRMEAKP